MTAQIKQMITLCLYSKHNVIICLICAVMYKQQEVILTKTSAAGLIIYYYYFTEYNRLSCTKTEKVSGFSKFSLVYELQPLQDHINPLIKTVRITGCCLYMTAQIKQMITLCFECKHNVNSGHCGVVVFFGTLY